MIPQQISLFLISTIDRDHKVCAVSSASKSTSRESITHIEMSDALARRIEFDTELNKDELQSIVMAHFSSSELQ